MRREEYPRPQFERRDWVNLNGAWSFEFDHGRSGRARGLGASPGFDREITVPFAPESVLSGVGHTDFIEAMWYHREVQIPPAWTDRRVLLRFGAVDFRCDAYIDGRLVGTHFGGTSSFGFDVTAAVDCGGTHHLVVQVTDQTRGGHQPLGKQSVEYHSRGCHYTRTTGIWQTVWLEPVHPLGLSSLQMLPDADRGRLTVVPEYLSTSAEAMLHVEVREGGGVVVEGDATAANGVPITIDIPDAKLWSPESPHLYDLSLSVEYGGERVDEVSSYAGLRKVHCEDGKVWLNNEPRYLRLVLDQGFYPDGIWTAPSDDALKRDIELSMDAGFNGARLHQKVFEERFHYWADRLGYLTWGESASWGSDCNSPLAARNFLTEWGEIVVRDRNHPSIIAWSPFNETDDLRDYSQHRRVHVDAYELTRRLDPTRPVNDASGYLHARTDLWTVHTYEQDPQKLRAQLSPSLGVYRKRPEIEPEYEGQPYVVDEFGGIKWDPETQLESTDVERRGSWGYGAPPADLEELHARLEGLIEVLLSLTHVCGYCYTQLTDVEQEQNGVYSYARDEKLDMERVRAAFSAEPEWWRQVRP